MSPPETDDRTDSPVDWDRLRSAANATSADIITCNDAEIVTYRALCAPDQPDKKVDKKKMQTIVLEKFFEELRDKGENPYHAGIAIAKKFPKFIEGKTSTPSGQGN